MIHSNVRVLLGLVDRRMARELLHDPDVHTVTHVTLPIRLSRQEASGCRKNSEKTYYVGMDVHKATIVIAVLDSNGKVASQTIIETSTQAVRDFVKSLRGEVHVTFKEGNHAA